MTVAWSCRWLSAIVVMLCLADVAGALSSHKVLSQYIRDRWGAEQGFSGGPVYAFAQTPDGYLWIGTERGLVRFDGLTFRGFQHSDAPNSPDGPVLGLLVDGQGGLWVRMQGQTLLRYRNGVFRDMTQDLQLPEKAITAMAVGQNGDILFVGLANGLVRYAQGRFALLVPGPSIPGLPISLAETADRKIWMGMRGQGLFYFENGRLVSVGPGLRDRKINALLAISSHELWIGTDSGIQRWDGTGLLQAGKPRASQRFQALALIHDRDANTWVATSEGLLRMDPQGEPSWDHTGKRRNDLVSAVFEDREGNLWVGTTRGLERLRDSLFTTYSAAAAGPPADSTGPIYADLGGRVWFAPTTGGLYWLADGRTFSVPEAGLARDVIYSLDGHNGDLWVGRQRGGLTHLRYRGNSVAAETFSMREGLAQESVYAVHQDRAGAVWAGTLNAGVTQVKNGRLTTYTTANGLVSDSVLSMSEAPDGTMWFGTPNGLNSWSQGQWRTYTSQDGLPPGKITSLFEDSSGVLWIGTTNGLAFLVSGAIQIPSDAPASLREPIFGIQEDRTGSLWIAAANAILRVDRDKTLRNTLRDADVREYGPEDGLRSPQGVNRFRSVVADSLGRIWFSTNGGLSFVDPRPMAFNSAPTLVHVEGFSADGRSFQVGERLRIPSPHQKIMLSYAGLSLAVPERVRFRFRLDGFDKDWSEPTAAREAVYTNLDSGPYRFRVMASNSDGLWNSSEAVLQFEVEPVFWRTWWFELSCVALLAGLVLLFLRLRAIQLTRRLNLRFEERLAERTRIAQDLHDTLLQGLLSASMQLHVADERLPADSPAKPQVGRVLQLMGGVIEEGRNAVQGLRSSKRDLADLAAAFSGMRQEFPVPSQMEFRVIVEGTPRTLRPIIRDEVYCIGHEALSNAFRHSHASDIEVELEYATSHLRLLVRDNGDGIDHRVLQSGRDGHWGLSGMKERSERIGAKLRVLSRVTAGTEVELSVPGHIAFAPQSDGRGGWLSRLRLGRKRHGKSPTESEQVP